MKKILLLYNSLAGDASFTSRLHRFIDVFQRDYIIAMNDIVGIDLNRRLQQLNPEEFSYVMVAGGDGTVSNFVDALMQNDINLPVGILPVGTSNDFATYLGLPDNFYQYYQLLTDEKNVVPVDVGYINGRHFINVCACGFLTSVPYETPSDLKNIFGKVAYYLKGVQKLTELKPLPLSIVGDGHEFSGDLALFLVLNSGRAGGFSDIVPEGCVSDGLFDFLAIKYGGVYEMFSALMDVFINKDWQDNDCVLSFRSDRFRIETLDAEDSLMSDIDGEEGPGLPLDIEVRKRALPFIYNSEKISISQ